ncbi:hypothetical protein TNCV_1123471 [Trichonephila clavipes]|uniref:Uncharacterized protein n=1 Tax=Trichonephila clavipes TaxID=2585209 RepID=A0A8X6SG69_TRICX|nr:hypothetical protein TNCV_1123471 [Trichonephila clavipes]
MMIPAYDKKGYAAFPFKTGIHYRRKTDFFPEEDTTMSYSGFEPIRFQAESHSHHTSLAIKFAVFEVLGLQTRNLTSMFLLLSIGFTKNEFCGYRFRGKGIMGM